MMTIEKAFGLVLRRLRREHNISQEKLSSASNLDRSFLSNIEGGKQQPSLISIFAIASALQVTPSSFLQETELVLKIHHPDLFKSESDKWEFDWLSFMNLITTDDYNSYKGQETILVVDDDQQLRNMLSSFLTNYGYKVMEAHNGGDAIHLYTHHTDAIHLILMDVVMPVKDGFTAYGEIKAINPDAKIIMMSGYYEFSQKPKDALIVHKPFSPIEIIQIIRNTIGDCGLYASERAQMMAAREWRETIDTIPNPVAIIAPDHSIVKANRAYTEFVGITDTAVSGMKCFNLLHGRNSPPSNCPLSKTLADHQAHQTEMYEPRKDKYFHVSTTPLFDGKSTFTGAVHVIHDINELVCIKEELLNARAAADAANTAKSNFLANMSHEIRTPMNGLLGMLQLLRLTELTEDQEEYLGDVETCANNLLAIINDILDLSKIEAGKVELEIHSFSLQQCVKDIILLQKHLAFEKGVRINVHLPDNLPLLVCGDQLRVKQILLNLLSNAVKYTEKGMISIEAALLRRTADQITVQLTVSDTGIGMSSEVLARIFDPFTQADSSITRKFGGTGLGLTICRQLAGLMEGRIWAESEEGKGSRFTLELPFNLPVQTMKTAPAEKVLEKAPGSEKSLVILIAEDNPLNQRATVKLLQKLGHQVKCAENGQQAVEVWQQGGIDLILMDIQMPVMDGCEVLQIIRAEEAATGKQTPVIALTAQIMNGAKEKMLKTGFDCYLAKPFTMEQLREIINKTPHE